MPLKPSGHTPTSSPPRSIRSASSLHASVAPPLRASSLTTGSLNTRSAPSGRRNRWAWSWTASIVISPSTGIVPEWLDTIRAPPSAGMFSVPRTSIAEPLLGNRSDRRHEEPLGDLGVEAVLVDGVVAGHAAAQERQERSQPRLPVLTEDLARGAGEAGEPVDRRDARGRMAVVGRGRRAEGPAGGRHVLRGVRPGPPRRGVLGLRGVPCARISGPAPSRRNDPAPGCAPRTTACCCRCHGPACRACRSG